MIVIKNCDADLLLTILKELNDNFHEPQEADKITLSMGGTLYIPYEQPDVLISRADKAMYCAKNAGKQTYRIL